MRAWLELKDTEGLNPSGEKSRTGLSPVVRTKYRKTKARILGLQNRSNWLKSSTVLHSLQRFSSTS